MTRTQVIQFTLVHVAKCHCTLSTIMSSYFPKTGFRAKALEKSKNKIRIKLFEFSDALLAQTWNSLPETMK